MKCRFLFSRFLFALALGLASGMFVAPAATEVWLSPSGNDQNLGTSSAPVTSLARAQELVRAALQQDAKSGVTVNLLPGDYRVPAGFTLLPEDSGVDGAPVVWRATVPGEARLLGCRVISAGEWTLLVNAALVDRLAPVAKGHVVQIDFAAAGVGQLAPFPDYSATPMIPVQLYADKQALPLSRWPDGRYGYTTLASVTDNGGDKGGKLQGGAMIYREDEPARWVLALGDESVWLRGFWRVPWVAETLRVKAIDPNTKTITFAAAASGGLGSKYVKDSTGKRVGSGKENWYALNLLEEIAKPGDWSIDFKRGKIYLWPPGEETLSISDNTGPLITFAQASYIQFQSLTLGWTVGDAIKIQGGSHITIASCRIREISKAGALISGGTEHALLGNDFYGIGLSAIDVTGGNRATLLPCHDEIENNAITDAAISSPIPVIVAGGDAKHQNVVGVHVAHNRIDGASSGGITFAGNDNLLEYNEIYGIGLDSGDLGAFYTTGGWTSRGNIVRYNFVHDSPNANGIYMDDGDCGLQAYGNLIVDVESGFLIGGGHDNILRNNLIIDSDRGFHIDDRGFSRHYTADDHRLRGDFNSVPVGAAPWTTEYPGLADFLKHDPRRPTHNVIDSNIVVHCGELVRRSGTAATLAGYQFIHNAELPDDAIFSDPANLDFRTKDPSTLTAAVPGFEPLPLQNMGLQIDNNRATLPPRDMAQLKELSTGQSKFDSQQDVQSSRTNP